MAVKILYSNHQTTVGCCEYLGMLRLAWLHVAYAVLYIRPSITRRCLIALRRTAYTRKKHILGFLDAMCA